MKKILLTSFILSTLTLSVQNVPIPDANFKAALVSDFNLNTNQDSEIQVSEATSFTGIMAAGGQGIVSLSGISYFPNITELWCYSNQLAIVDLSQNTDLLVLRIGGNQLTSLGLGANVNLITLDCSGNDLSTLYLPISSSLQSINCKYNNLTSLDLAGTNNLTFVLCFGNQLSALNVSNLTALEYIECGGNLITSLDFSNCTSLTTVYCESTPLLTSLNLANGNNSILTSLVAYENPNLTCIQVDNASYSNTNWINEFPNTDGYYVYDPTGVSFSEDCAALASIESFENKSLSVYPNPTESVLNIELQETTTLNIVNLVGASVAHYSGHTGINTIDVNHLPNGMYFVESADFAKVRFVKK